MEHYAIFIFLFCIIPVIACEEPVISVEIHESTIEIVQDSGPQDYTVKRSEEPTLEEDEEQIRLTAKQKYALIAAAITTGGSIVTATITYLLTHYLSKESE